MFGDEASDAPAQSAASDPPAVLGQTRASEPNALGEFRTPDPIAASSAAGYRLASLEPTHRRRASGAIIHSQVLGRLEFVRLPPGRNSFWLGRLKMPDSPLELQLICEVEHEDVPGVDHAAAVITIRRHQVKDAAACLPLVNTRLREMGLRATLDTDDLFLTAIHLPPRPMFDPLCALEYQAELRGMPLIVTVGFERGTPRTVHIARAASELKRPG
jgi:hypothetical protein